MRRSRGGDVSLPAPMADPQGAATPQLQRGPAGVAGIGRAAEIGGEMDQLGDGAGGLAAMQRVNELLDKRGPLSKDFCLDEQAYFQFWTDISRDIKLTGTFLADLVGKIAQVEKDLSKSNPKASDAYAKAVAIKLYGGDQRQALHSIRNALLSSIFFVQLHFDFEIRTDSGSDALGTAMQRWGKRLPRKAEDHASAVRARDQKQAVKALEKSAPAGPTKSEKTTKKVQQVKAKQSEMAASAEFALEVYNYVEEKGEQLGEHKLFSAVTDQLESVVHIESKRGMNEPFDVPAQVKEKTIGPAWTWLYLRHRFATHVELTRALNEIVDMLRVHNTEHRLLCLLQMLTEIIHSYPCLPIDPLRRLKAALDPFYCWPCPFGPLAQRLIATAEREIASPGAAFRHVYLLEHPSLAIESGERENLSDLHQPVVPVYFDSSAANAHFVQLSLTTPVATSTKPPTSYEYGGHSNIGTQTVDDARKMLLHIFQRAGAEVLELPSDAAEQLSDLLPEDVLEMYTEARQVDLEAQQRRPAAAARAALDALGPIALKAFGESIEESAGDDSPWKRPRRLARSASSAHEILQAPTSLSLDNLAFELHPQAERIESQDASGSAWPTEPVLDALKWLRGHADRAPAGDGALSFRVAVAGGSQAIHHVLNAIELLRRELFPQQHRASRQLKVSIFLIPTSPSIDDNALAECIARSDCWYGRHVAIPWSTLLPAIPHVVPPGSMNATQDWEPEPASASPTLASFTQPSLAPCMAMRNLVQNYVRHAGNQLDVNVFCCHCWLYPGRDYGTETRPGMYTIYGCDRVSFGSVAYMDASKLIEPKAKEPSFPQIDLEFRMIGLDGSQTGRKEFRASHFRTLDVCNVPRRGQTTACPIPSEPVLELVSKPREPGKKKKGSTHVDLTDLAEHVDEVTIKASPQPGGDVEPFFMVADGVRYGPFAEVYVTCHSSEAEPAQLQRTLAPLQVMTYLPLSQ